MVLQEAALSDRVMFPRATLYSFTHFLNKQQDSNPGESTSQRWITPFVITVDLLSNPVDSFGHNFHLSFHNILWR